MMAPVTNTIEIARPPADVFAYMTDVPRHTQWQVGVSSSELVGDGPMGVGSRIRHTRRMGPKDREVTLEVTRHDAPGAFAARGVDGPIRVAVDVRIDALDDGARSKLTATLDFEGRGLGKLIVPLARRQSRAEMPETHRRLKQQLEQGG